VFACKRVSNNTISSHLASHPTTAGKGVRLCRTLLHACFSEMSCRDIDV